MISVGAADSNCNFFAIGSNSSSVTFGAVSAVSSSSE